MNIQFKKLALFSLIGLFTSAVYAHTGVRDQVDESKGGYNGFTITHGCGNSYEGGPVVEAYPVLGQSALFPWGDNVVWRNADGAVIARGGNGKGVLAAGSKLNLAVTGYAGLSSAFAKSEEIVDALGNVHALHWKKGAMEPKLNTVTPFKITAPTIADNCVKSLKVRVGVINWCDVHKNAANDSKGPYLQPKDAFGDLVPMVSGVADHGGVQRNVPGAKFFSKLVKGNGDNNRADWWFGDLDGGSHLYNDPDLLQHAATASAGAPKPQPYWTTLTINNSAADITACKKTGGAVDVIVEPMGKDFDTYLTGANTQPFTTGKVNF
jgi:hypothetical protein